MTEYWKQSPNYWCKYCATYVRDSKLERQNHEATAKHQNAIKRSLRDLHRSHEREERDKERARREVDRLNGVVAAQQSVPQQGPSSTTSKESSLKRQREQLAELGVSIPSDFRAEMAMPGEWTVTSTRVVQEGGDAKDRVATGVRKREQKEEEKDEEDAVRNLFKKPRRWGRDSKALPEGDDTDLDALLSGAVELKKMPDARVKTEGEGKEGAATGEESLDATTEASANSIKTEEGPEAKVKLEEADAGVAPVVFKKRKAKGLRTK